MYYDQTLQPHTHVHTHIRAHTHTHTYVHTHTHGRAGARAHARTHTHNERDNMHTHYSPVTKYATNHTGRVLARQERVRTLHRPVIIKHVVNHWPANYTATKIYTLYFCTDHTGGYSHTNTEESISTLYLEFLYRPLLGRSRSVSLVSKHATDHSGYSHKKRQKKKYVEEDGKNAAARLYVCPVPSQHECIDIPTRKEGRFRAIVHPGGKHDMYHLFDGFGALCVCVWCMCVCCCVCVCCFVCVCVCVLLCVCV